MAARADELSVVSASPFSYYADANVFEANVTLPIRLNTDDLNLVKIECTPGHLLQPAAPLPANQKYFTYSSAYSELSAQYDAVNQGYRTTATGVINDLSILHILTAKQVVGQISTFYPENNAVPTVSFLGTQIDGLCIHTQPLVPSQNLGIFGAKPAGDGSYFSDASVLSQISAQYYNIVDSPVLPASLRSQFTWNPSAANSMNALECSLVNGVSGVPTSDPTCGNVIVVPGFGQIFLEQVVLSRTPDTNSLGGYDYMFSLEMIRIELQGIGAGTIRIVALDTNGTGAGGGGPHPDRQPAKSPRKPGQ
ncbi:MAG TPA: hypothetical protein VN950_05290 [Terriglobales bacterium]|nr:hypothetical protein [Terriglobales bacterium]